MPNRIKLLAAPALLALASLPPPADAKDRTDHYYVRNHTSVELVCSVRKAQGEWTGSFRIRPNGEWSVIDPERPLYHMRCGAPVISGYFPLRAGERYSFRRNPHRFSEIMLRRMVFD